MAPVAGPAALHAAHTSQPSAWLQRHAGLLKPGARVLDVACGSGRNLRWLAGEGHHVTGVDRDAPTLAGLQGTGVHVLADIENGPWPFVGQAFDGVVVFNYLWRPLLPVLQSALVPGGVLIYETFAHGQQTVGRPARPEFLLQPGELLRAFEGLQVVAYEDGFEPEVPRFVQRIAAVKNAGHRQPPPRHKLAP